MESSGNGKIEWTVSGVTLELQQDQGSHPTGDAVDVGGGGGDSTGWRMWNSGMVLSRYLEANYASVLRPRLTRRGGGPVRVLDLSCGPGLLGLGCAVTAAVHGMDVEVVLTEMPNSSLDQLNRNVVAVNEQMTARFGDKYRPARAAALTWGEPSPALLTGAEDAADAAAAAASGFDVVLVSDCLFIAVRDYLYTQFLSTMKYVCLPRDGGAPADLGTQILFAYEVRHSLLVLVGGKYEHGPFHLSCCPAGAPCLSEQLQWQHADATRGRLCRSAASWRRRASSSS